MGPVAVMLSYSLHKTYHQRIALYCAAYFVSLLTVICPHFGNKNKNSKGTSTVKLVDHWSLLFTLLYSMVHSTGADDDIFTAGYIIATKQII